MDKKNALVIGINALFLIPNQVGGTEYHLRSFLKYLEKLDTTHSYVVFCNNENYSSFTFTNKNWNKVLCPVTAKNKVLRIIYEQSVLPCVAKQNGCTILHSYGYFGPVFGGFKKVITVHDANWLDHPEDNSFIQNFVLNVLIRAAVTTAAAVVTDSEFSSQRLQHFFPGLAQKLHIIWPGIDDAFANIYQTTLKRPLKPRYLLAVSALYPHKKMLYLLKLWEAISKKDPKLVLVVVGQHGTDAAEFQSILKKLDRVLYYPKVGYRELVAFYKFADLFVFPSVYEGFGFPVYEAYFSQLPILVGKRELYAIGVQAALTELDFEVDADSQKVLAMLSEGKQENDRKKLPEYTQSVHKLLKIFQSL